MCADDTKKVATNQTTGGGVFVFVCLLVVSKGWTSNMCQRFSCRAPSNCDACSKGIHVVDKFKDKHLHTFGKVNIGHIVDFASAFSLIKCATLIRFDNIRWINVFWSWAKFQANGNDLYLLTSMKFIALPSFNIKTMISSLTTTKATHILHLYRLCMTTTCPFQFDIPWTHIVYKKG